jgi:hypothetical protein
MQRKLTTLALTITALTFGSAVSAKTLVYCSEGSPEISILNSTPQVPAWTPARYRFITGWLILRWAPPNCSRASPKAGR